MPASSSTDLLIKLLTKYAGVPNQEAVLLQADLDEIREDVITVSNSEIKNLVATQKELVAAPGAGKMLVLRDAVLKLNAGSEALTEAGDNLQINYVDGAGVNASGLIESTGFIDQVADTYAVAYGADIPAGTVAQVVNTPLVLDNVLAEIAGNASNDATMTVTIRYSIIDA